MLVCVRGTCISLCGVGNEVKLHTQGWLSTLYHVQAHICICNYSRYIRPDSQYDAGAVRIMSVVKEISVRGQKVFLMLKNSTK